MTDLILHLKTCYFLQIKDGTKAFESGWKSPTGKSVWSDGTMTG
jgi:hypothetical protein